MGRKRRFKDDLLSRKGNAVKLAKFLVFAWVGEFVAFFYGHYVTKPLSFTKK
jgi:hypothetical protein